MQYPQEIIMGNYQSNIELLSIILTNSYPLALDPVGFTDNNKVFNIRYSWRNLMVNKHCLNPIINDFDISVLRLTCKTFKYLIDDYFRDAEIEPPSELVKKYGDAGSFLDDISSRIAFGAPWWTMRQYLPDLKKDFLHKSERAGINPNDLNFNPHLSLNTIFKILVIRGTIVSHYSYTNAIGLKLVQLLDTPDVIYLTKSFAKCRNKTRMLFFLNMVAKLRQDDHKLLFLRDFLENMLSDKNLYNENIFNKSLKMMKWAGACMKDSNLLKDPEGEIWLYHAFNEGIFEAIKHLYDNGYLDVHRAEFIRLFPGMWHSVEYFLIISALSKEMFDMANYIQLSLSVCEICVKRESPAPFKKSTKLTELHNKLPYKIIPPDIYVNDHLHRLKTLGEIIEKRGVEPNVNTFKYHFMAILKMLFINEKSPWNHSKNAMDIVMSEVFLAIVSKTKEVAIWEFFLETLLGPLRDCIQGKIMIPSVFASIIPPVRSNRGKSDYVSELIIKLISYIRLIEDNEIFQKESIRNTQYIKHQNEILKILKRYLEECKIRWDIAETPKTEDAIEVLKKIKESGALALGFIPQLYIECFQEESPEIA